MWFAMGLVTLAGAMVATGYRRLHAGELPSVGKGFRFKLDVDKSQDLERVRVSVTAPPNVAFECKRESGFDEWCKRIGLVREMQSGHPRFDRWVYVLSDDRAFRDAVAASLAEPLVDLFVNHDDAARKYVLQRLVCRDGRLVAVFKVREDASETEAMQFMIRTADALKAIATALPTVTSPRPFLDPLLFRSALVLGASTGLALTGALQMARIVWTTSAWTYDATALFLYALMGGGVLLVAMIAAAIALLGRTARLHLILVEICLFGAFGAVATSFAELRDANMEFESAPPLRFETRIVDKHISRGRRHTTHYVELADWNAPGKRIRLDVSGSDYQALQIGPASIRQHTGALGVRWIDDLRQSR